MNNFLPVRFQVLTAASMKVRIVFWHVLQCKIIVDRRFRGTCRLHHQGWVLWNVGRQLFYTAVHPRRQFSPLKPISTHDITQVTILNWRYSVNWTAIKLWIEALQVVTLYYIVGYRRFLGTCRFDFRVDHNPNFHCRDNLKSQTILKQCMNLYFNYIK
jgi:hypothetical protein